jgi:hypothetical protein
MKFLCLVHMDEALLRAASPEEERAGAKAAIASDERLRASGHYIASEALAFAATARIVRVRAGRTTVSDGPFIETREQLGGFILIEAADMEEAIDIAATIPMAQSGTIEVRPVKMLSP